MALILVACWFFYTRSKAKKSIPIQTRTLPVTVDLRTIPEIRVETDGDDVTYCLPMPPLGKQRWIGLIPAGFWGLWVFAVGYDFLAHDFLPTVHAISNIKQPGIEFLFVAVLLGFVWIGCIPAYVGLVQVFGRHRIIWRDGRLLVSFSAGLFNWRGGLPRVAIRNFVVKAGAWTWWNVKPETTGPPDEITRLVAVLERGRSRVVAAGYPREWMEALASDLSARAF